MYSIILRLFYIQIMLTIVTDTSYFMNKNQAKVIIMLRL